MTTSRPNDPPEPSSESDEAIEEGRRADDQERHERRQVHDRTRQRSRGGRAGLDRERALDDASLEGERRLVDRRRVQERSLSDQASRRHAALLEAAEDRLDDAREEEAAAALERRQALRTAGAELTCLHAALAEIQARSAPTDHELWGQVDAAMACAGRLGRVLAQALDATAHRGNHHDVGGID
jgi:hypothetical protein